MSKAGNFIVKGDAIISGYGFTAEKDHLYILNLNKSNGRIVQRVSVCSAPDFLVEKGGRLFARTYNTDYVFKFLDHK